jgi:hypothetical protein
MTTIVFSLTGPSSGQNIKLLAVKDNKVVLDGILYTKI